MKTSDLKPNQEIDSLKLEITEIGEPREFSNFRGSGRVANAKGKDKMGEVILTLWNDDIDEYKVGDKIQIENGWTKEYQGKIQVGTGRGGTIKKV